MRFLVINIRAQTMMFCSTIANKAGLFHAYGYGRRKITKSQVGILVYHHVCPEAENWSVKPINPIYFEKQLEILCRNYEIITLENLTNCLKEGKKLPSKACAITFDDGYKDNYIYAYPILNKHHIPGTIFITTGYINTDKLFWFDTVRYIIDNIKSCHLDLNELGEYTIDSEKDKHRAGLKIVEKLKRVNEHRKIKLIEKMMKISNIADIPYPGDNYVLSWEDIKEMSSSGIDIGAHTVNHPILTNLPPTEAKEEIIQSKIDIENMIGKKVTTFAYPNGNYNDDLKSFIRDSGFICALSMSPFKLIDSGDDIYSLSRIPPNGNIDEFNGLFCGLLGDLASLIGRIN